MTHTKLFQEGQPLHQDLRDLIYAHAVFWKDKPIYAPGTANLAAMLLVSMPVQEAFLCLVNIVNKSLLKTFYAGPQDDVGIHDVFKRASPDLTCDPRLRHTIAFSTLFWRTRCPR